jgi:L-fuconolactonase
MIPVVDTHNHLWDLDNFELEWLSDPGCESLRRSFLMSDYIEATADSAVARTVYMEVDVARAQREAEADFVVGLCRRDDNPMAGAVIGGGPAAEGFMEWVGRFKDVPEVKGFREVLQLPETPRGHCIAPAYVRGVGELGDTGKSYDVCMRPAELADAVKLADACPDTLLIIDHCGNADPLIVNRTLSGDRDDGYAHDADQWRRDIAALGNRENTVCKISGIIARAPEGWTADTLAPTVEHCLDSFSPDRVVFGGDWPVCTWGAPLSEWISALREIVSSRPEQDQVKLLHANADRLYGLI